MMKTVTYRLTDGTDYTVEYDENAPCWCCGLPVIAASTSGTVMCPWCDMGKHRDGRAWTFEETTQFSENFKRRQAEARGEHREPQEPLTKEGFIADVFRRVGIDPDGVPDLKAIAEAAFKKVEEKHDRLRDRRGV